jgi:hypothetical protein
MEYWVFESITTSGRRPGSLLELTKCFPHIKHLAPEEKNLGIAEELFAAQQPAAARRRAGHGVRPHRYNNQTNPRIQYFM